MPVSYTHLDVYKRQELLNEASGKLTSLAATLSSEDSKDLSAVTNLLSEDPETIASFLSSPVKLDEKKIYPIENYGSATVSYTHLDVYKRQLPAFASFWNLSQPQP